MGHLIHDDDFPDYRRLMAAFRSGRLFQTGPNGQPFPYGRPNIRAVLLEDLVAGDTVDAAVTRLQETNEIQVVDLRGEITGGEFTLSLNGETTAAISHDATADQVREALEALPSINSGDVIVEAYSVRWVVQFTGQYAGLDVSQMTAGNSLSGIYNLVRVDSGLQWVDANRTEEIHCQLPVMDPTPLKAGAVVSAGWFPEALGRYCILNAEPRDLDYEIDLPSYSY